MVERPLLSGESSLLGTWSNLFRVAHGADAGPEARPDLAAIQLALKIGERLQ
jgi:hypothetical protein